MCHYTWKNLVSKKFHVFWSQLCTLYQTNLIWNHHLDSCGQSISWKEQILTFCFHYLPLPHIHHHPLSSSLISLLKVCHTAARHLFAVWACMYFYTCTLCDCRERWCDGFGGHGCYVDGWLCLETEEVQVNIAQLHVGEAAGRGQRSPDEKAQS